MEVVEGMGTPVVIGNRRLGSILGDPSVAIFERVELNGVS